MADENIQSEPQPERTPEDEKWPGLGKVAVYGEQRHMNKSTAIVLATASLIVGLIIGGLTVALVDARQNEAGVHYASDFIMRQQEKLNNCEQQNKDLLKKTQELEQRQKDRP